jgi:DNA-binding MarR family transcriptional regulator
MEKWLTMAIDTAVDQDVESIVHALPEIARAAAPPRHTVGRRLGVPQVRALLRLATVDALSMGELARGLGISFPAASQIGDQLVEVGLAVRERPDYDRRVVLLRLTDDARAMVHEVSARRRRQVEEVLTQLAPAERRGFARGMRLLAEVLVRDLAVGAPAPTVFRQQVQA